MKGALPALHRDGFYAKDCGFALDPFPVRPSMRGSAGARRLKRDGAAANAGATAAGCSAAPARDAGPANERDAARGAADFGQRRAHQLDDDDAAAAGADAERVGGRQDRSGLRADAGDQRFSGRTAHADRQAERAGGGGAIAAAEHRDTGGGAAAGRAAGTTKRRPEPGSAAATAAAAGSAGERFVP